MAHNSMALKLASRLGTKRKYVKNAIEELKRHANPLTVKSAPRLGTKRKSTRNLTIREPKRYVNPLNGNLVQRPAYLRVQGAITLGEATT